MKTCCFKLVRGILPAVVLAALGFSYALMTPVTGGSGVSANGDINSRATIITNCTRTSTQFVTESDLGLVVVGSQFTRQIVVQYGFKPHTYLFGRVLPTDKITISNSGTLSGNIAAAGVNTFEITVADELGGDIVPATIKTFSITSIPATKEPAEHLHIVNASTMPDAVANEPYAFTFNVNGGLPPFRFFLVDGPNGALPPGLALNTANGQLSGKPTFATATPFEFTIGLVDSTRLVEYKDFTLNVRPGTVSSDLVVTNGSMILDFGTDGSADSLTLTLAFNKFDLATAGIRKTSDLVDQSFAMDFGGIQLPDRSPTVTGSGTGTGTTTASKFPSKFDKNGSIRYPSAFSMVIPPKKEPRYTISVNPQTGILKVTFTSVDLIRGLGARFSSFKNPVIPISVKIGAPADAAIQAGAGNSIGDTGTGTETTKSGITFDRTDSIKFLYTRRGAIGRATADTNTRTPAGGLFLVTKVQGSALRQSTINDHVVLNISGFMRLPGGAVIKPSVSDRVQVLLGEKCLGDFPASTLNTQGDLLTFTNTDPSAGLKSLSIDNNKGTFSLQTFDFNTFELFKQDILEAGVPFSVPLTLTIANATAATPTFDGQTSVTVFRKGNSIINK